MAKIVISVTDKKNSENCDVKLEVKNTKDASKTEMITLQNVYNVIVKELNNLQNRKGD